MRKFATLALSLASVWALSAQNYFYVHKTDGNSVQYAVAEVDSISFSERNSGSGDTTPDCTPSNVANGRNAYCFTTSNANTGAEGFCYVGNGFSAINICDENYTNGNNLLGSSATTGEVAIMVDLGASCNVSSVKLYQGSTNASYPDSYCSAYTVYCSTDAVSAANKGEITWTEVARVTSGSIYDGSSIKISSATAATSSGDTAEFGAVSARSVKIAFDKDACHGSGSTAGTVSVVSLQVYGCTSASGSGSETTGDEDDTTPDILFIGNSMTYYNTLCNVVKGIASIKGHTINTTAATNGGRNLIYQSTAANVLSAIQQGGYEVVVLQDIVGSFNAANLAEGASALIPIIKASNPNAEILFYEPWPVRGSLTGTSSLLPYFTYYYAQTARQNGARLAPAGEAFYDLFVNSGLDYYCSDDKHPQPLGTFISASTIYYTLFADEAFAEFSDSDQTALDNLINTNVAYTTEGQADSYSLATLNLILSKGYQYARAVSESVADATGATEYTSAAGAYTDLDKGMNPANLAAQTGTEVETALFTGASNLALGKTATASSGTASLAVDGNTGTRWESTHQSDPQWLTVDLGETLTFSSVGFIWEAAYAATYYVQTSTDGNEWTTRAVGKGDGAKAVQLTLDSAVSARYVRIYGTSRATGYGYSFYEMGVWE